MGTMEGSQAWVFSASLAAENPAEAEVCAANQLQYCYSYPMSAAIAPHPLVREAVYLHEIARLTDADIARATGVARSTARAWLAHTRSPTGERAERLIELSALVERLARVMEPSYIAVWLRRPVPALQERKPIDVIASGKYMDVAELVSALEEAPFS
jgi:uncharacterized protein (DUF2384 family)